MIYRKPLIIRCGFEKYYNLTQNIFGGAKEKIWKIITWFNSNVSYKVADRIFLTSYLARDFVVKTFKIDPNKIDVSYNYIDSSIFKPIKTTQYVDRILFIGRLNKAKNLFSLLDAVSKTKYYLDIVGDGELKGELINYISKNNICASLLGRFANSDIPNIINRYLVFILPSHYEGNPKALLEAMACGSAVICTDIAAIREIIKDGKNGLICTKDSNAIAKAITLLMQDANLRIKLGENAKEFIRENCHLDQIVDNEYASYQYLINKNA